MFPRAAFSEMMGWHGGRDGLVDIWSGMPFFSPVWGLGAPIVTLSESSRLELIRAFQ